MANLDKKKQKIKDRILFLENEMRMSLIKKTSNTKEISIGIYQRQIADLNTQLLKL